MSFLELSAVLGNFGEFLGAIAVVATLFYLAIQIRENTRTNKANITSVINGSFNRFHEFVMTNSEMRNCMCGLGDVSDEEVQTRSVVFWLLNQELIVQSAYENNFLSHDALNGYKRDLRWILAKYPGLARPFKEILESHKITEIEIFEPLKDEQL